MKIPRARKDREGNLEAALPRVFVTQQMRDWVDATAASQGVSAGDVIREAVRRMMEGK